ncbi:Bro-N domain-containing protein [Salmonella enterica subsp. diarizonae serovar 16:z10:e,n,x,z15]
MNSVQKNELTFHNVTFNQVSHENQIWLTSSELAKALGYKKSDAVTQIYSRYHDEFTESMSTTLKMSVVRKTGAVDIPVRVFSLRGAHLISMFANTPVAKEFRRWVLDILDREVADKPESSPLNRFHTKVTVMDNIFGGEIEFYGKAEDLNAIASGICRTLGFEPSGFKQIPMDTKRIRKIH